ncbi:hypothetical protein PAPYR_3801 [Paratrimastix pyriformis]|uniref:EGF-like domain-containing protein n=1 Tax=Paratrimastix pyriformis TaxID=342808 RepID=A0ABQ8ULK1_9EUKA|nr:hypothetical protein PAPYR_3801 [Paratrimastix pyriformis]
MKLRLFFLFCLSLALAAQVKLGQQELEVEAPRQFKKYESFPQVLMETHAMWKKLSDKGYHPTKRFGQSGVKDHGSSGIEMPEGSANGVDANMPLGKPARNLDRPSRRPTVPENLLADSARDNMAVVPNIEEGLQSNSYNCSSLNNCNGHGSCVADDVCQCKIGWYGTPSCDTANPCTPGYVGYNNVTHFVCNGTETNAAAAALNASGDCYSFVNQTMACRCPLYLISDYTNCSVWRAVTCRMELVAPNLTCPNVSRYDDLLDRDDVCLRLGRQDMLEAAYNWTCHFTTAVSSAEAQASDDAYSGKPYNKAWDYWLRNGNLLALRDKVEAYAYWKAFDFRKLSDQHQVYWRTLTHDHWAQENSTGTMHNVASLRFAVNMSLVPDRYLTANRLYSEADVRVKAGMSSVPLTIQPARRHVDFPQLPVPVKQRSAWLQWGWILVAAIVPSSASPGPAPPRSLTRCPPPSRHAHAAG